MIPMFDCQSCNTLLITFGKTEGITCRSCGAVHSTSLWQTSEPKVTPAQLAEIKKRNTGVQETYDITGNKVAYPVVPR